MGYRICYEKKPDRRRWLVGGVWAGVVLWCASALSPVWQGVAAGEGLYEALARFVGGMIRGH